MAIVSVALLCIYGVYDLIQDKGTHVLLKAAATVFFVGTIMFLVSFFLDVQEKKEEVRTEREIIRQMEVDIRAYYKDPTAISREREAEIRASKYYYWSPWKPLSLDGIRK